MVSLFGRCKCLLVNFLIFYTIYLAFYKCPFDQPLTSESPALCPAIHSVYHRVAPIYSEFIEPPYFKYVHPQLLNKLDSVKSTSQPIVYISIAAYDKYLANKVNAVYSIYIRFISPTLNHLNHKFYQPIKAHFTHYYIVYEPVVSSKSNGFFKLSKNHAHRATTHLKFKSVEYGLHSRDYFFDKIHPLINYYYQSSVLQLKVLFNRFYIVSQYFIDANIKPHLNRLYYKLKLDIVGIQTDKYYHILKIDFLVLKLKQVYQYLKFQQESYRTTIETKQDFLKSEFMNLMNHVNVLQESVTSEVVQTESLMNSASSTSPDPSISITSSTFSTPIATQSILEELLKDTALIEPTNDDKINQLILKNNDLSNEILEWQNMVLDTCDSSLIQLNQELIEFEDNLISKYKPDISDHLKNVQISSMDQYKRINRMIINITLHPDADDDFHVSRQDIRDEIKHAQDSLTDVQDYCRVQLEAASDLVEIELIDLKQQTIDILEEFADITIQEFSKKMVNSDDSSSLNKPDWNNWKEFAKIRKFIYATRDKIYHSKLSDIEGDSLTKYIREIQFTTNYLIKDGGQYLAILRAQANLAFQTREEEERSILVGQAENNSPDDEEGDITETTTIVKTVVLGDDGEPIATHMPIIEKVSEEIEETSSESEMEEEEEEETKSDADEEETPSEDISESEPEPEVPELVDDEGSESENEEVPQPIEE